MIWRIDARIIPQKPSKDGYFSSGLELHTFYIDAMASDVEAKAFQVLEPGRKNVKINIWYASLFNPTKSQANRAVKEGLWLDGIGSDEVYSASKVVENG